MFYVRLNSDWHSICNYSYVFICFGNLLPEYQNNLEDNMGVAQTKAAKELMKADIEMSSHRLISLLMAGALERVEQATVCILNGDQDDKKVLIQKIIAILHGLQASLNYESGGEIAINLSALYDYMLDQVEAAQDDQALLAALGEVNKLVLEIKDGWDQIVNLEQAIAC